MIERLIQIHREMGDLGIHQSIELQTHWKVTQLYIEYGLKILGLEKEQSKILWQLAEL